MGTDKAFVLYGDRPMVELVAAALRDGGCDDVVCQGGDRARLAAIGFDVVPDPSPGTGPVGAIHSALQSALQRATAPIVVAACDLACLDAASVSALIQAGREAPTGVAVAVADGRRHLLSYWAPDALGALAACMAAGVDAYRQVLSDLAAVEVPVESAAVRNVNHPDDLA